MEFLVGSILILALVILVFGANAGFSLGLLGALRGYGYTLLLAVAGIVAGADVVTLLGLFLPSVVLYEVAAMAARPAK